MNLNDKHILFSFIFEIWCLQFVNTNFVHNSISTNDMKTFQNKNISIRWLSEPFSTLPPGPLSQRLRQVLIKVEFRLEPRPDPDPDPNFNSKKIPACTGLRYWNHDWTQIDLYRVLILNVLRQFYEHVLFVCYESNKISKLIKIQLFIILSFIVILYYKDLTAAHRR